MSILRRLKIQFSDHFFIECVFTKLFSHDVLDWFNQIYRARFLLYRGHLVRRTLLQSPAET